MSATSRVSLAIATPWHDLQTLCMPRCWRAKYVVQRGASFSRQCCGPAWGCRCVFSWICQNNPGPWFHRDNGKENGNYYNGLYRVNKPPPLNRDYNRDPYIKALKRRELINRGSTLTTASSPPEERCACWCACLQQFAQYPRKRNPTSTSVSRENWPAAVHKGASGKSKRHMDSEREKEKGIGR